MDGVPFDIETPVEHAHRPPPYEINGGGFRYAGGESLFFKHRSPWFLSRNGRKSEPK
jgi:hypothetical protein